MTNMSKYFSNATKLVNREYPWSHPECIETYITGQVEAIQNAILDKEVFAKDQLEQSIRMRKWYIGAVDVMWEE